MHHDGTNTAEEEEAHALCPHGFATQSLLDELSSDRAQPIGAPIPWQRLVSSPSVTEAEEQEAELMTP